MSEQSGILAFMPPAADICMNMRSCRCRNQDVAHKVRSRPALRGQSMAVRRVDAVHGPAKRRLWQGGQQ